MSEKRDIPVGFKLSESDKARADIAAAKYGHKPGSLAGVLLRQFLDALDEHGDTLKFPPTYDYYETGSYVDQKIENDPANDSSRQKAG